MYLVGLTGGIGSGKSTVADLFASRGAVVIDADAIARDVVAAGTEGFAEVVDRFGAGVVGEDGELDRQALARIVFDDPEARRALNGIVHPRVGERIGAQLTDLREHDVIVVLDVPLLVESGMHEGCDAVVVVTAPEDLRVERLVRERDMDPDDVRARIAAQAGDAERTAVATHVIVNDGDLDALEERTNDVYDALASLRDDDTAAAGAGT